MFKDIFSLEKVKLLNCSWSYIYKKHHFNNLLELQPQAYFVKKSMLGKIFKRILCLFIIINIINGTRSPKKTKKVKTNVHRDKKRKKKINAQKKRDKILL